MSIVIWLLASLFTLGAIGVFHLTVITGTVVLVVFAVWAVIIWGGFFIFDSDGELF